MKRILDGGVSHDQGTPNVFSSVTTLDALGDPTTGQPFPGNLIPKSRQNPNGLALDQHSAAASP
jgi:hypothetical protein